MTYAVQMQCKEVKDANGDTLTQEGTLVWVCQGEWGVECSTGSLYQKKIPSCVAEFETEEAANKYMKTFKGNPWYYKPNGKYKVFKLNPVYKQVFDYWEISE